ncbi:MAG: hypothetical protein IJO38_08850 [Akkermansia sp.]|nr:hypothetical protein [Akkermansia sp.]
MKKSLITMMAAAMMSTAFAGEATTDTYQVTQQPDFKRLSGAVHIGAGTAYTCHGYVPTRAVVQGEGMGMAAVQLGYDFGKESFWSYTGAISYKAPFSGHTLYGNPSKQIPGLGVTFDMKTAKDSTLNIENEFIFRNGLKYTRNMWNTGFGYDFIHGGIPGVVAKHFDGERQSRMQQVWWNTEITPVAWFSADMNVARTFDTIDGWWFEWHARFKAPIIGSPEDITVAGILEFGLSATSQFYSPKHNACDNGLQAYWVKLSTPWFVNEEKSFILTPSVSFNWLGRGGRQANTQSEAKAFGPQYTPFRDFAVVGDLTATYKF